MTSPRPSPPPFEAQGESSIAAETARSIPQVTTESQRDPTHRTAHRHHHTPGHGHRSRIRRLHRHHHHHHNCCGRNKDGECGEHGEQSDPNAAGSAPRSATFGSYPLPDEQADGAMHGGYDRPLRTAPLPLETTGEHTDRSEASRKDVSSSFRRLLLPEGYREVSAAAMRTPAQQTPAPSYHSASNPSLSATNPSSSDDLPARNQQLHPMRSFTSNSIATMASSNHTFGPPSVPAPVAPSMQSVAQHASRSEAGRSPHVRFIRSSNTATLESLPTSGDEGAPYNAPPTVHEQHATREEHRHPVRHSSLDTGGSLATLQARDRRLSSMLDDVVKDPRTSVQERQLRKRTVKKERLSIVESVLGLDEMTPGDLIYSEGSKVDGGFGFALPRSAQEQTLLLDSRPERESYSDTSFTSSRFSTDTMSDRGSRYSGSSHDIVSEQRNSRASLDGSERSLSGFLGRFKKAKSTSLADRVDSRNLRPSHLDLRNDHMRANGARPESRRRASDMLRGSGIDNMPSSTWEDVVLDSGGGGGSNNNSNRTPQTGTRAVEQSYGKNDRLADSLGVRRAARRPSTYDRGSQESDLTVIDEEEEEKQNATRSSAYMDGKENNINGSGYDARSRYISGRSDADGYRQTMNLPPGLSQADIVAICLVQGMVPPGLPPDETLVTWSGPLSPNNPRNWSPFAKWYACILVSWSTFLANAATNMIAPALGLMSVTYKELYIMAIRGMLIGAYIFAFTFSPLVFGPMSEIMGRKPVLIAGMVLFTLACLLSGFVTAVWQLLILRFLAAFGASAPMSIGGAVLTDIFAPDQRGRAMTVFALAPQLGPVLGPIMGGWVTQEARNWRWIFFIAAICGFIAAAPMLFIRESYTPQILARRAQRLRKETGNPQLSTIFERRQESKRQILTRGVVRPLVLFSCEPIVQLLTVYVSLIYGIIHLVVATFPAVFGTIYAEYPGWASMHFICIGIGTITGGFLGGYLVERHYHRLSASNRGVAKPEFKFYCMLYTVWIPPLGLMIYGIITYFGIHWIFADLGIVIFCCAISIAVVAIQSYMVDCYTLLAGSALTATIVFRSIVGTGATIGSEDLLLHAGMLWSNVALASACILIGVPAAYVVYFWGPAMRQKSRHATHKR